MRYLSTFAIVLTVTLAVTGPAYVCYRYGKMTSKATDYDWPARTCYVRVGSSWYTLDQLRIPK